MADYSTTLGAIPGAFGTRKSTMSSFIVPKFWWVNIKTGAMAYGTLPAGTGATADWRKFPSQIAAATFSNEIKAELLKPKVVVVPAVPVLPPVTMRPPVPVLPPLVKPLTPGLPPSVAVDAPQTFVNVATLELVTGIRPSNWTNYRVFGDKSTAQAYVDDLRKQRATNPDPTVPVVNLPSPGEVKAVVAPVTGGGLPVGKQLLPVTPGAQASFGGDLLGVPLVVWLVGGGLILFLLMRKK